MSDINNDKKFGKLVESIGKATSRYRKTKKEADGNVSVAKKTVKSAVNSRKKAKRKLRLKNFLLYPRGQRKT